VIFTFRGANTLLQIEDLRDDAFAIDLVYIANLSNQSADCFPRLTSGTKTPIIIDFSGEGSALTKIWS